MPFLLLVFVGPALLIAAWAAGAYNRLVSLRNRFKAAFAQIDVQLKRRYDLIPNLVETVKGYLAHERQTLDAVVAARAKAVDASRAAAATPGDAGAMKGLAEAEGHLSGLLGRLFALAEAYPNLKANENMMHLSGELTSTENKVAAARQAYNDTVMAYNTAREQFPSNLVASVFGFAPAALWDLARAEEREPPQVKFT